MNLQAIFSLAALLCLRTASAAILDVTLAQFDHVANHISQKECKQLVAALEKDSSDLDPRFAEKGLKLPESAPCIQLLVKWGEEEGKEEVLVLLQQGLRQLHHPEVSDWLSTTPPKRQEDFEKRKCKCRNSNATSSTTSAPPPPTKTKEKEQEKTKSDRLEPNSKILDGLRNPAAQANLGKALVLGLLLLAAVFLLLLCARKLGKWCCQECRNARNRKKGYRNVELRVEENFVRVEDYENAYCKC